MHDDESLIRCPAPFQDGRFVMDSLLGRGGMAEVYRAYDQGLGRWRAIKIMLPSYVRKKKLRARFETEAKAMALLEHRNIVRVYDVGNWEGAPYIVMELCPGGSLEAWLMDKGAFAPRLAVDCGIDVCHAIEAAHAAGVIHRDIKSQNVLVGADGSCKVTDFGIAQTEMSDFTNTGSTMGTLGFMAPEQRSDAKKVDARSDVYSIGATLYNLLTARVPTHLFAADQDDEILAGVYPALLEIIKRATEYKRELRFQTVAELRAALEAVRPSLPDAMPGQVDRLRGDYTPPPVPRVKQPTPPPAPARDAIGRAGRASLPPGKTPEPEYVISVPPELVRQTGTEERAGTTAGESRARSMPPQAPPRPRNRALPPLGAHQAPAPAAVFWADVSDPSRPGTAPSDPPGSVGDPSDPESWSNPGASNPGRTGPERSRPGASDPGISPTGGHAPRTNPGPASAPPRPAGAAHQAPAPEPRAAEPRSGFVESPSMHPWDANEVRSNPGAAPPPLRRTAPPNEPPLQPQAGPRPPPAEPTRRPPAPAARPGATAESDEPESLFAELATQFLDAMAGPGRFLVLPLLLLILIAVGFSWWNTRNAQFAEGLYASTTADMLATVDRERAVVDELAAAGADATLLRSHLADYDAARGEEARQIAARRLIGVLREELRKLPTPRTPYEVRERRRMQQAVDRLSTREDAWEEAKAQRARAGG